MERYTQLKTWERDGLTITVSYAPDDSHPGDYFDDTAYEIADICNKIDRGILEWFILRATVTVAEAAVVLATEYAGGLLYERVSEVFEDGVADELVAEALASARDTVRVLKTALEHVADTELAA